MKIYSKLTIIKMIAIMAAILFAVISLTMDYVKNKDLVMEVEATVIDSVNYSEESNGKLKYIHYKSTMICEWEVNGEKYNQKFEDNGTYLKGDKITIEVFKDNPGMAKNLSLSNVIGAIIFFFIAGFIFFVMLNSKKLNRKLDLIEEQKYNRQDQLYIDIGEEKIVIRKIRKRIFLLELTLAIIIFAIGIWVTKNGILDCYYDDNREGINVECLVIKADNYTVADREYSDIQGQWEIDGQVYKKVITNLTGEYLDGKTYNIEVEKDTEESMKIKSKPKMLHIIESFLLSIGSIVAAIIFIKKWKKDEGRYM